MKILKALSAHWSLRTQGGSILALGAVFIMLDIITERMSRLLIWHG
nr:hypothetical protein [Veillonella denticariosi]